MSESSPKPDRSNSPLSPLRTHLLKIIRDGNDSGSDSESHGSPKRSLVLSESRELQCRATLARQGYLDEDKLLVPGITIRAATVDKLSKLAVECFDQKGCIDEERRELPRVFFLMHQWFISSEELAEKFLDLYNCDNSIPCLVFTCEHRPRSTDCPRQRYKAQVCHTVRFWIRTFPVHFDLNPKLTLAVQKFQETIVANGEPQHKDLVDISKVPSYDWMRNMSVRTPARHSRKVSLVFNNLQPAEVAEQLTFLEYKAFRRITFNDFKHYAVHVSLKENPKLERSIALFNGLSQWIQCMVLSKTTPQQRCDVIIKFVNVAKRLRELQNFNTLMAVVGGLTHSALARLGKTNSCLPADTQKILMEYTELLSSSNNFSHYRKVLLQCKGFRIPILGVHLKDLILLHTALPDKVEGSVINFRKMAQLSVIFTELMQVANATLPVEANMDLVNTIRLSLDLHYTEDEIYELSLAREPRNSLSSPSTPTKPVVFADWVAGVSPPDAETINKHVYDMVEAVFKNYDHDKDGFISHAEFEAIAGNFPFIDSFCVLDADQDGMISKAEMKTYFNRANCHALRNSFKHDFHETTYFKPTFCIHCTGLLWGLIKQGWRCKDCGINAHKHCKDLVVMECRAKGHGLHGRSNSFPGNGGNRDVTMASKRKMSQRQKRQHMTKSTQTDESLLSSIAPLSPRKLTIREEEEPPPSPMKKIPILIPSTTTAPAAALPTSVTMVTTPVTTTIATATSSSSAAPIATLAEGEFYEEQAALYDRLLKAEEMRDRLAAENWVLRSQVEDQGAQIDTLKSHLGLIRQHTLTFILDQMDTLNMQRDTEV